MTPVPHIPLRRPAEPQPINLTAWAVSAVAVVIIFGTPAMAIYALFLLGAL